MHSPGDKKAADLTEFILLRWLETSPPNSRVYLPQGLEKNSIDDLVCGNFVVIIFGAKTGDIDPAGRSFHAAYLTRESWK
ncbi:MAG: hypothetical protein MO847_01815 [Candidatus Protistobacter heckmanni]|nr:hypothetical protein [Candidatus Protistobacter heckmanni]